MLAVLQAQLATVAKAQIAPIGSTASDSISISIKDRLDRMGDPYWDVTLRCGLGSNHVAFKTALSQVTAISSPALASFDYVPELGRGLFAVHANTVDGNTAYVGTDAFGRKGQGFEMTFLLSPQLDQPPPSSPDLQLDPERWHVAHFLGRIVDGSPLGAKVGTQDLSSMSFTCDWASERVFLAASGALEILNAANVSADADIASLENMQGRSYVSAGSITLDQFVSALQPIGLSAELGTIDGVGPIPVTYNQSGRAVHPAPDSPVFPMTLVGTGAAVSLGPSFSTEFKCGLAYSARDTTVEDSDTVLQHVAGLNIIGADLVVSAIDAHPLESRSMARSVALVANGYYLVTQINPTEDEQFQGSILALEGVPGAMPIVTVPPTPHSTSSKWTKFVATQQPDGAVVFRYLWPDTEGLYEISL